jgi:VacB/RNase II family 3'-5' exoribonuclease
MLAGMNHQDAGNHRSILQAIARRVMVERGLLPDFSAAALAELSAIKAAAQGGVSDGGEVRDLTGLLWCSIDNDDSLDLDQLTVAQQLPDGRVTILVAVADVDSLVGTGTALDQHAGHNTTSIYTAAQIFPMLPEELSTGLTSLNQGAERSAVVVEMVANSDGSLGDSDTYRARVRNRAKLAYNSVAAWLDGIGPEPVAVGAVPGLAQNLRLQDQVAQRLKALTQAHGALTLETTHAVLTFSGDSISGLSAEGKNRAKDIIAGFMISANGATARFLAGKGRPSIRRVVRTPDRWDRIVQLAAEHRFALPAVPDPLSLEKFLTAAKAADPMRFPDLSLAVIKLLGSGEYVAEAAGDVAPGHFGLAVKDYGHSTAPNRRYTDLITQRLLKAALEARPAPYSLDELNGLAQRCTQREDDAAKVERQVNKAAAALFLQDKIGEEFDALVTGTGPKGTWVRLLAPPVEGMLAQGAHGVDVGDRLRVRLTSVDVERGYIDFARAGARQDGA